MRDRPISVCSSDGDALRALLRLHAVPSPRICDVTANRSVMWRGLDEYPRTRCDLDPDGSLLAGGYIDHRCDFRALPFADASYDVLVFDPPHLTESGHSYANEFADRYGLKTEGLGGANIDGLFAPFLAEARRVLVPDRGVVLAKVADQVHRARYQFQHVALILAARLLGFTPCDLMIRLAMQRGGLVSPDWKHVYHVRSVHTYWLCLRNGSACCSATAPEVQRSRTGSMFAEVA